MRYLRNKALSTTLCALTWLLPFPSNNQPLGSSSSALAEPLAAIPGVVGFGSNTIGGSGRHRSPAATRVVRVWSLADSGRGTLRACLSMRTPRTCVFDVSGEIRLRSMLTIRSPFITVAGQTAPSPGITITNGGIKIQTHNVVIQHLAIRPGDSRNGPKAIDRDAISIGVNAPRSASQIVLDHLSLTWALDENASTWSPTTHHVTISNSLIAEGLQNSIHPKGPHSKGLLIGNGSRFITVGLNALIFNDERNPYLKPGSSTEFVNNFVYGWGSKGGWSLCNLSDNDGSNEGLQLSFMGNVYTPGPESACSKLLYAKPLATGSLVFEGGNVWGGPPLSHTGVSNFSASLLTLTRPAETVSGRAIMTAEAAHAHILTRVGSRPAERSPIDQRILTSATTGQGTLKDCLTGCIRNTAPLPRYRRRRRAFIIPRFPMRQAQPGGYTALELALHRRAAQLEL
jgi:hypothetical protein